MMLGRNGVILDVSQISLSGSEMTDPGEVWSIGVATDLIEATLSVRTMVSRRGLARIHAATHQSRLNICPHGSSPPSFPSLDLTYPDLYCANFDCASHPGGPTCLSQPVVAIEDFLEMLPTQESVVISRRSPAERDVHCAIG